MQKRILITGATGFVGTNLVARLLYEKNVDRIFCTARHETPAAFWSSIEENVKKYDITTNVSDMKSKVEVIKVDLLKERDQLVPILKKYNKTINVVHHLASDTTYGTSFEHYKPWVTITKNMMKFCMDAEYPKYFYGTGSYGHHLYDWPHGDSDAYWVNGYFAYKKWLHHYSLEKMSEGLKGRLFEPGYIVGPTDPGQVYMLWRIVRTFTALGYACRYKMLLTPIDMILDNYLLAMNHPNEGPKVMCVFIPKAAQLYANIQEVVPDLKVVDYETFRDMIQQKMPQKAKYFGTNFLSTMDSVEASLTSAFHPLYNSTRYAKINMTEYLLTCKSFNDALKQGQNDRKSILT